MCFCQEARLSRPARPTSPLYTVALPIRTHCSEITAGLDSKFGQAHQTPRRLTLHTAGRKKRISAKFKVAFVAILPSVFSPRPNCMTSKQAQLRKSCSSAACWHLPGTWPAPQTDGSGCSRGWQCMNSRAWTPARPLGAEVTRYPISHPRELKTPKLRPA